jgi:peptidoglycan hydrolase-like protein with peptidoglycan-binding domain
MERWKILVALTAVGALAAGPAWAQSGTTTDKSTTGTMDKDKGAAGTMDKGATGEMKSSKGGMKSDHAQMGGNKEQVKAVQQALKDKGHDPGNIDGVMGPKTKAALKEFQKAEGLKESGRLDNETMSKLGVEMKSSGAGSSMPSASPQTEKSTEAPKADTSKPDSSAQPPSASPSTPPSTPEKPADTTKPSQEKKY